MVLGLFIIGAFVICTLLVLFAAFNDEPNQIQVRDWREPR